MTNSPQNEGADPAVPVSNDGDQAPSIPPPPTPESTKLAGISSAAAVVRQKLKATTTKRRKHIPAAIMRRRHDVWEMMCQGIPRGEMARILGVCENTIGGDVRYWRGRVESRIGRLKGDPQAVHTELGLTAQKLDSIAEAAFQEYSTAKTGNEKDKFLNTAAKALGLKTKILQETGFLPKAGIEIKAQVQHEASFADRFGPGSPLSTLDDPTSRHKVLAIASRLIRLAENEKPIDVDAVVKKDVPQLPLNGGTTTP